MDISLCNKISTIFKARPAKGSTEYIMQLRELYNKYHDRGLEIYMVSLDDNAHFWKEQVANLPWINVYDDTGISQAYTAPAQTVPIIYLIDRGNKRSISCSRFLICDGFFTILLPLSMR